MCIGCSGSNASCCFLPMETATDTDSTITLLELSAIKEYFSTVTTVSYVFSLAMNKSLHAVALLMKCTIHCFTVLASTVCSPSVFSMHQCQCVQFFLHGGIQFLTFASHSLPCQMPFCWTAPLLPPVAQQQNTIGKVHPLLPHHHHIPLSSLADIIK